MTATKRVKMTVWDHRYCPPALQPNRYDDQNDEKTNGFTNDTPNTAGIPFLLLFDRGCHNGRLFLVEDNLIHRRRFVDHHLAFCSVNCSTLDVLDGVFLWFFCLFVLSCNWGMALCSLDTTPKHTESSWHQCHHRSLLVEG